MATSFWNHINGNELRIIVSGNQIKLHDNLLIITMIICFFFFMCIFVLFRSHQSFAIDLCQVDQREKNETNHSIAYCFTRCASTINRLTRNDEMLSIPKNFDHKPIKKWNTIQHKSEKKRKNEQFFTWLCRNAFDTQIDQCQSNT